MRGLKRMRGWPWEDGRMGTFCSRLVRMDVFEDREVYVKVTYRAFTVCAH